MSLLLSLLFIPLITWLLCEYIGPGKISLTKATVFGIQCLKASDLIIQEFDANGNLWATRGLTVYRLKTGEDRFIKVTKVPTGFSVYFLNNFRFFRNFTLRAECTELTISDDGSICAFSSGRMWYKPVNEKKFHQTMSLHNFGRRIGRGVMSTGLVCSYDQEFLIGEYFSNPERKEVRIYRQNNLKRTWESIYEFKPGQIRHIHALQVDPYSGKLWLCTGDEDHEAMIGWLDLKLKTFITIGKGSQQWRACQLVFTESSVYWGTDTGHTELAGIYKWDKIKNKTEMVVSVPGAIFFGTRLANGTIIMSTDREGFKNERDDLTRLFVIHNDRLITTYDCGTWMYKKRGFRFNFAKLRLQRNQGNNILAISCLNQKEVPDGDLLIYSQDAFIP